MKLPEFMQAWVANAYGGADVLSLERLPVPKPGASELLIRVEATTVSSADRRIRAMDFPAGMGLIGRMAFGWGKPRRGVLGVELTGIVMATGPKVRRFKKGDAVIASCGMRRGAHAEYATIAESDAVVPRPKEMPIEIAAALGFGGMTARHFLRRGTVQAGEQVLVIGASGTVGSAIVQLAVDAGAIVTAVCSAANLDTVRKLGAIEGIDYQVHGLTQLPGRYDIVADTVGSLSFATAQPILFDGGRYLAIAGGLSDMLSRPRKGRRCIAGPAPERAEDLEALVSLWAAGRYAPEIDSILAFGDMRRAHERANTGRKVGSIVVRSRC